MTPEKFAREYLYACPARPHMVLKPTEVRFGNGERARAYLWHCYSDDGIGVSHNGAHAYWLWNMSIRTGRTMQQFPPLVVIAPNQKHMVVQVVGVF